MAKRYGFTLAEVLITLGIIGVVAAMTIPSLINNHKKVSTVSRLKHAYSMLAQTIERAKVDYGDPSGWGFDSYRTAYNSDEDKMSADQSIDAVVMKYIVPYIKGAEYHTNVDLKDFGYDASMIYMPNGDPAVSGNKRMSMITIPNGVNVICYASNASKTNSKTGQKDTILSGINFLIDINGPKGPNISGRDCFVGMMQFDNNTKFLLWQQYSWRTDGTSYLKTTDRAAIVDQCRKYGTPCGALIQQSGWTISSDYPLSL